MVIIELFHGLPGGVKESGRHKREQVGRRKRGFFLKKVKFHMLLENKSRYTVLFEVIAQLLQQFMTLLV